VLNKVQKKSRKLKGFGVAGGGHREGDEDVDQRAVGGRAQRQSRTLSLHTRRVHRQVRAVLGIRYDFFRVRIQLSDGFGSISGSGFGSYMIFF
jgi:hypothetical protein